MTISVLLAHPNPESFNHAIANTVVATLVQLGHVAILHDLYAENFDPVLPATELAREAELVPRIHYQCEELRRVEGLVFVHPNWWGMPPAILTGWVDRVLRPGVAYQFVPGDPGGGVPIGLLKARTALVLNTSDTTADRERAAFGDPLDAIWRNCILALCGVERVARKTYSVVVTSTEAQRNAWLEDVVRQVAATFGAADGRPVQISSR